MIQLLRYIFWNAVYIFRNRWKQETFNAAFLRISRCWNPYRAFKPYAYHSDSRREWDIYFDDASAYTERRKLDVEVMVSNDTGEIVGLTIWDETLKGNTPHD